MAGEYIKAMNKEDALRKIKAMYPKANKFFVDRTPDPYTWYAIADMVDLNGAFNSRINAWVKYEFTSAGFKPLDVKQVRPAVPFANVPIKQRK